MSLPTAPAYEQHDEPPTYEQANVSDVPPSYDSLFGEFRQVESPKGLMTFLQRAWKFIGNTVAAMIALAFLNIIPLSMIFIGAANLDHCPVEDMIPRWLIITGVLSLAKSAISFVLKLKHVEEPPRSVNCVSNLLSLASFVWFIFGAVWVYTGYGKYSPSQAHPINYCDSFTMIFRGRLHNFLKVYSWAVCRYTLHVGEGEEVLSSSPLRWYCCSSRASVSAAAVVVFASGNAEAADCTSRCHPYKEEMTAILYMKEFYSPEESITLL